MANVLMQSLNKMHMKYVFHNKFRKIMFHDQKALSSSIVIEVIEIVLIFL